MSEVASQPNRPEKPQRLHTAVMLAVFVLLAFGLRAWALWRRNLVDFDETYYYMLGRSLFAGKGYILNGLPHTAFPPLYPIFVGLTNLFTDNIRLATSLVSAVTGALLPIPVYFLAKDIHGRKAALLAAGAAAVWRGLFFFAAANVPYAQRLYFGSEPLYVTLIVSAMLFIWRFSRAGGWGNAVAAGTLFGLAALVRSEGPVVFAFLLMWLIVDSAMTRALWQRARIAQTAVLVASMMIVFSPFLVYVRAVSGTWSLGAKLDNNARIRQTLWEWVTNRDNRAFLEVHYALNDTNSEMEDPYWGVSAWHRERLASEGSLKKGAWAVLDPDRRWLKVYTDLFWNVEKPLVPRYAWALVIVGLFIPPWSALRARWWLFSFFNFLAMALLATTLYALPRHELPLLALFAVGTGKGLEALMDLFRKAGAELLGGSGLTATAASLIPVFAFYIVMANSGAKMNEVGNRHQGTTIDMGLALQANDARLAEFLKKRLPAGGTLMCNQPWLALWAEMEWRVCPFTTPSRLLEYAKNKGIDYAVIYPWQLSLKPQEMTLIAPYVIGEMRFGEDLWVLDLRRAGNAGEGQGGAAVEPAGATPEEQGRS